MDFPGEGVGSPDPAAEKDPRELDPSLEGAAGDSYVKCGKCQACYPMDLEVRFLRFVLRMYVQRGNCRVTPACNCFVVDCGGY